MVALHTLVADLRLLRDGKYHSRLQLGCLRYFCCDEVITLCCEVWRRHGIGLDNLGPATPPRIGRIYSAERRRITCRRAACECARKRVSHRACHPRPWGAGTQPARREITRVWKCADNARFRRHSQQALQSLLVPNSNRHFRVPEFALGHRLNCAFLNRFNNPGP